MSYRNSNYCAFYVDSPFNETNLGANQKKDFNHYNLLKAWKAKDDTFPFKNAHDTTYNVRDGSDWESTLKPRLHKRLNNSKNIILFLSSVTKNSTALREEIDYGANSQGLPIIVVYPELTTITNNGSFTKNVTELWDCLPVLKIAFDNVPTIHILWKQEHLKKALQDKSFMVSSKIDAGKYYY